MDCHTVSVFMDMFFFLRKWFFKPHDVTFFKLLRALPLDSHLALISEMTYNVSSGTLNTTIPIPGIKNSRQPLKMPCQQTFSLHLLQMELCQLKPGVIVYMYAACD